MTSKNILILANGNHKIPMRHLKKWLESNLSDYYYYSISSQFLFTRKILSKKPYVIILYNKDVMKKTTTNLLIEYCKNGGKIISLHHNLASIMIDSPSWLKFMGVRIIRGDNAKYPWRVIKGGDLFLINLNPNHKITTENVNYSSQTPKFDYNLDANSLGLTFELNQNEKDHLEEMSKIPAIKFNKSEYFINHVLEPNSEREILFGLFYNDSASGRMFYSSNGGWTIPKGKGRVFYFMPGDNIYDFNDNYSNIIKNCILF